MTSFEMIKYHVQEYPADVPLRIEEIAAHFDIRMWSSLSKTGVDQYITAGFNAKAKNDGIKPFVGRVVSDLHLVYTF